MSVLLLGWVLSKVDPAAVVRQCRSPGFVLAAAALGPFQILLSAERWRIVCERVGQHLGRERAVREVALSTLLDQLLPTGFGGSFLRSWRARSPLVTLGAAVRSVAADRLLGFGVHLAVVGLGLAVWDRAHPTVHLHSGIVGLWVALVVATVGVAVGPLRAELGATFSTPASGLLAVGLSVLLTGSFLAGFALCGRAVGADLGWTTLTAVPLILLAMAVPVSVGGWGLREATAVALLPRLGWSDEAAVALAASYGLSALLGALPGAFVWIRR